MSIVLGVLCLLQLPALLIFMNASALDVSSGGYVDRLVISTLGNLGQGTTVCQEGIQGDLVHLQCPTKGAKIRRIEAKEILLGRSEGACNCPGA